MKERGKMEGSRSVTIEWSVAHCNGVLGARLHNGLHNARKLQL